MNVAFDTSKLSITKPYLKDNGQIPKHYMQYLRYHNGPLHFQSALFYSNGPKMGISQNYQLCVTLTPEVRQSLMEVEKFAAENVQLLSPFAEKWNQYSSSTGDKEPFKSLYQGLNLFIKMGREISLYNLDNVVNGKYQPFQHPPVLGAGWYIVSFSAPSIFIGSHNSNPKVASLQLRIDQIVYRPKPQDECHIQPLELTSLQSAPTMTEHSIENFINDLFSDEKPKVASPPAIKSRKRNKKGEMKKTTAASNTPCDSVVTLS